MGRDITNDEIRDVCFSLHPNKAPGPDGFNAHFFKKTWDIVGEDVINAIQGFFRFGLLLKELNATIIALVPKVLNPSKMKDFRPISCCNTLYKIIAKIIANRIKPCLPDIISPSQSAFVAGRSIGDNIVLAQELMRNYHKDVGCPKLALKNGGYVSIPASSKALIRPVLSQPSDRVPMSVGVSMHGSVQSSGPLVQGNKSYTDLFKTSYSLPRGLDPILGMVSSASLVDSPCLTSLVAPTTSVVAAQVCQSQQVGRSEDSLIGVPVHSSKVGAMSVSSEGPSSILDVSAGAVVSISSAVLMVGQGSKVGRDFVSPLVSFAQPIVSSVVSVDEVDDRVGTGS
ncbi:hypothetical protein LWI29_015235 [Acer saccharum]|uniref:Reverse transcriptase domain-containing protein n=1 Tax=Acer saccharum TaxID=4024 RepID=A0AA39S1T6_ACESA|nr:hypothetical protein LWI29_015235 [Acer saccharum]